MMLWDWIRGVRRVPQAQRVDLGAIDERAQFQERRSLEQQRETDRIIRLIEQQNIRRRVPGVE